MASCLICNAPPSTTLEDVKVEKVWGREMEVMFALQQVLQVPASLLANFLAESATGNVGLLTLCPPCRQLVGECREVEEQLQKLKRRWIKCSARVVAKVKDCAEDESPEQGPLTQAEDLRQETRRFVINHEYPFEELKRLLDNQTEGPEGTGEGNAAADPPTNGESVVIDEGEFEVPDDAIPPNAAISLEEGTPQPIRNPEPEANAAGADVSAEAEVPEADVAEGIIGEAKDAKKEVDAVFGSSFVAQVVRTAPVAIESSANEGIASNGPAPGRKIRRRTATHECLFCSKTFFRKFHLEGHMRVHTGERPFWCGVCGQEFSEKSSLTQHQRRHTKPYECDVCNARFTSSHSRTLHLRWHWGVKPFACPDCDKAFVSKANLRQHHVVHTGEKPYKCDKCPDKFAYKSALYLHKKRKHANK